MKLVVFALLVIINSSYAQQRLSLDVSYRKMTLNSTLGYHKVIANNWLISCGLTYGGKGRYSFDYRDYPSNSNILTTPYSKMDQSLSLNDEHYGLKRYDVHHRVISAQFGIGYFYNFDVKHGIRGHLNILYGVAKNKVSAYYSSNQDQIAIRQTQVQSYISALSAELYHTIHLWKKSTFFYGVKVPYYFTIDKKRYNPTRVEEGTYGLEPEIVLGLTLLIGKC